MAPFDKFLLLLPLLLSALTSHAQTSVLEETAAIIIGGSLDPQFVDYVDTVEIFGCPGTDTGIPIDSYPGYLVWRFLTISNFTADYLPT